MSTKKVNKKTKKNQKKIVGLLLVKIGSQEAPVWLQDPMALLTGVQLLKSLYQSQKILESSSGKT